MGKTFGYKKIRENNNVKKKKQTDKGDNVKKKKKGGGGEWEGNSTHSSDYLSLLSPHLGY